VKLSVIDFSQTFKKIGNSLKRYFSLNEF